MARPKFTQNVGSLNILFPVLKSKMATKLQKIIQEVEVEKAKLQSFSLGQQDAQIIEAGCKSLRALIKLYSQFKGQSSQQTIIKENLIGIYNHLLKVPKLYSFDEFEKLLNSQAVRVFGEELKNLHYYYACQEQKQNNNLMLEYHLRRAVQLMPTDKELCQNLSQYYMDNNALTNAFLALKHYRGPFNPSIFYQKLYCLNKMCHFDALEKEIPKLKTLLEEGDRNCILLFLKWIGLDNPTVFLASKNYQKIYEEKQDFVFQGIKEKKRKIRLAYIGSNFIPHAQSTQFGSSFFANHDKDFDIYIYSLRGTGISDSEKHIKEQVHHYISLTDVTNEEAVERIRKDQIDIIVNCNGHADDRRPYEILYRRVAPIQVDYLGYPGTSGASYIDYYVGDPISTPIDQLGRYFTEKLILLPHTYQVTEHAAAYSDLPIEKLSLKENRAKIHQLLLEKEESCSKDVFESVKKSISDEIRQIYGELYKGENPLTSFDHQVQWLDEHAKKQGLNGIHILKLTQCIQQYQQLLRGVQGDKEAKAQLYEDYLNNILPPESFVQDRFIFCSLNHHVKLSRRDIACWNEILKKVKKSVLVLFLMFSYEPQTNLLKYFDSEVIDRIYFVRAAPKWLHLHRLQGMDCILDSFYYGAHTSAGDAIWAQVPVVTRLGEAVESRVCSSMLHAAGLNPLISNTVEDYIDCAVKCATDSQFYNSCLQKLKLARQSPLFDREAYIRHLNEGYRQAWEKFCEGKRSDHIEVKPSR